MFLDSGNVSRGFLREYGTQYGLQYGLQSVLLWICEFIYMCVTGCVCTPDKVQSESEADVNLVPSSVCSISHVQYTSMASLLCDVWFNRGCSLETHPSSALIRYLRMHWDIQMVITVHPSLLSLYSMWNRQSSAPQHHLWTKPQQSAFNQECNVVVDLKSAHTLHFHH